MISYEQLRQRHIADALRLAPEMIEAMEWSEERLVAERRRRLRKLVLSARSRSRWHGARLAGVDVDRLDEITLRQLPVMTKHDLDAAPVVGPDAAAAVGQVRPAKGRMRGSTPACRHRAG